MQVSLPCQKTQAAEVHACEMCWILTRLAVRWEAGNLQMNCEGTPGSQQEACGHSASQADMGIPVSECRMAKVEPDGPQANPEAQ